MIKTVPIYTQICLFWVGSQIFFYCRAIFIPNNVKPASNRRYKHTQNSESDTEGTISITQVNIKSR